MAKAQAPPEPKRFTPAEIPGTVTALQRRIGEVQALIDEGVHESDPRVKALETNIRTTIARHFGAGSKEAKDHEWFEVDRVQKFVTANLGRFRGGGGYPGTEQKPPMGAEARKGYEAALVELKTLMQSVEEQREDPGVVADTTFGLLLHATIADAARDAFLKGRYKSAILEGFRALRDMVRARAGSTLDGADLMRNAFSPSKGPLVVDPKEQEGVMHLFEGAAMGIRNRYDHGTADPPRTETVEVLAFLSYLARQVDAVPRAP
jgi:uncharacterized protein (TIGR02391 family)